MKRIEITRRQFTAAGLIAVGAGIAPADLLGAEGAPAPAKILSHNLQMGYRQLGRTGLWLSEISLGGHGPHDPDNRKAVLLRAHELGINCFDADNLKECRLYGELCRTNKLRSLFHISFASLNAKEETKEQMLANIDDRLRDFGTDCLDLWRPVNTNLELVADTFAAAKKAGKVRFMGISSHDPLKIRQVLETIPEVCSFVMLPYMSMSRELDQGVMADCRKKQIGVIAIKPLSAGNLPRIKQNAALHLKKVLSTPSLACAIPGVDDVKQLEQNVQASYTRAAALTDHERQQLADAEAGHFDRLPEKYQWLSRWREV